MTKLIRCDFCGNEEKCDETGNYVAYGGRYFSDKFDACSRCIGEISRYLTTFKPKKEAIK
jgi:hypothetical protein